MDCQPLHRLPGIQASSRSSRRIQRKVYIHADDSTRGVLCHVCRSHARNLSELPSTRNALAIHRHTFGDLNEPSRPAIVFIMTKLATNFCHCWTSVAPSSVNGQRSFLLCKPDPVSEQGVSFATARGLGTRSLALRLHICISNVRRPSGRFATGRQTCQQVVRNQTE
jgi:hypothetical protein